MSTLVPTAAAGNVDLLTIAFDYASGTYSDQTSTSFHLNSSNGVYTFISTGQNLTYSTDGKLTSGTITASYLYYNPAQVYVLLITAENLDAARSVAVNATRDPLVINGYDFSGADNITGSANNDILVGYGGTDAINGGGGVDTAVYFGPLSSYTLVQNSDGSLTVADNRPGSPDGVDTLVNIETLRFTDRNVDLAVSGSLTVGIDDAVAIVTPQSYAGKTLVSGELDVAAGGSIAASAQVALKAIGAVFDVSGAGAGGATVTIKELSGVAGSTIKLGAGVLSISETTAATYAGAIADGGVAGGAGGGLVVNGSAALTLTGADTFTGKTQIYGQLNLAGSASLNESKAVTLKSAGALFDISAAAGRESILNLAGVAGSHIALGANTLKVSESTAATFAGVVSDGGAAGGAGGALIVSGTATLTLTGASTFTGGVTLQGGVLELGSPTAAGVGHALTFAGAATLRLDAGALSGSGAQQTFGIGLAGFNFHDRIDLASLAYGPDAAANYGGGVLTVTSGGAQVSLALTGATAGGVFTVADDGSGHVVVGLVGGT